MENHINPYSCKEILIEYFLLELIEFIHSDENQFQKEEIWKNNF